MGPEGFRKLALSLPGAEEREHMDHPDFRVGGRIFATLGYPDERWAMVKLRPKQQAQLLRKNPGVFTPVKGGWGLKGATHVRLKGAEPRVLREALGMAWRNLETRKTRKKVR